MNDIFDDDGSDALEWISIEGLFQDRPDLRTVRIASHLMGVDLDDRRILSDRSWSLFEIMYEYCGGFQTYTDARQMALQSSLVYAVYDGKLTDLSQFSIDRCYVIGCFKSRCGLKLVGMAKNPFVENRQYADSALGKMVRMAAKIGWFEVSGRAEEKILMILPRSKMIPASTVKSKAFPGRKDFSVCEDGVHYTRSINGTTYKKAAFGVMR